ncbi:MAG: hypothetical protein LBF34_01540 [Puniceicoccales bacterium]|jgi:hypothetical protein|nr:hypothetical protein [Puniceicoccales bacterium]
MIREAIQNYTVEQQEELIQQVASQIIELGGVEKLADNTRMRKETKNEHMTHRDEYSNYFGNFENCDSCSEYDFTIWASASSFSSQLDRNRESSKTLENLYESP